MLVKSHLQNASLHNHVGDESGLSPSRFPPTEYLDIEDPNDTLRNPKTSGIGASGAGGTNTFSPPLN